jgi:tRNA 5-methylaminomethyl-2-thiouridine biosynthesis bifunctional protein
VLAGCALPQAWSGAPAWTVLDLEFGDGSAFFATLRAWHAAPRRPPRLHYAALLPAPLTRDALRRQARCSAGSGPALEALIAGWPMPLPGVHRIGLDDGRIRLTLAIGAASVMLPGLVPAADSIFAFRAATAAPPPGTASRRTDRSDAALLRRACATLRDDGLAAAPAGDPFTARALEDAGMLIETLELDGGERVLRARPRPRSAARAPAPIRAMRERSALVVGAGLAGCAAAYALARRGWSVDRLGDRRDGTLAGSFQPVLAHHPSVTPDDAPLSRLTRAALLLSRGEYDTGAVRWIGRLQQCSPARAEGARASLPSEWVQAVDAQAASARAGIALHEGGLWLPSAGCADPAALLAGWTVDGITVHQPAQVACLERSSNGWLARDHAGGILAEAPIAIVATGHGDLRIDLGDGEDPLPVGAQFGPAGLQRLGGGTTLARPADGAVPRCVLGGPDGHAIPLGDGRLLLGPITPDSGDAQDRARLAWARYASRLASPDSRRAPTAPGALAQGSEGIRLSACDHLPLAGPVPDAAEICRDVARLRNDDRRMLPTLPGLWIAAAFGGRGLLWSVLCAELLASRLDGEPSPLEHPLVAALDPGRFMRRALRRPDTPG